ncbi:LysR substrate-binding domain-containing protein [Aestuariispira insulae]|uniref:LysR family transcriptional regulator n=1 Tax=Aestuariispira insulae TaxID=1461337 RepID=A0A3D9HK70_9PROT|nr:LysR substrate-binding domain-containing protein [Aestuariispira insulae]RED49671.1 LysR family transcriptional regulator [Aestuariispira insulae]
MNYSQLRAFHRVALEGSFTRAARALRVSQPTLSAQVKELEESYGVRLFDRRGRGVTLTQLGISLQSITNRLFSLEDEAESLLSGARDLTKGHLSVGSDSPPHVMPILSSIKKNHPGLSLSLSMGNADAVLRDLLDYRTDVAVLASAPNDPRLHILPYRKEKLILFVPKDHELAEKEAMTLSALNGCDLVLRERGSITRVIFEDAMQQAHVTPSGILEIQSREACREAVAAGLGIGVVFESEFGVDPDLVSIPIKGHDLEVGEYVVCLRDRKRLANIQAFLSIAEELAD